jgi:hypothetical protein
MKKQGALTCRCCGKEIMDFCIKRKNLDGVYERFCGTCFQSGDGINLTNEDAADVNPETKRYY